MRKYVLRFLIIYKRIANAYTRCRRITNPTERISPARLDLPSNRNEDKHFKCVNMLCGSCLFISALQMLILDAVGLQIRRSGKTGAPNDPNTCTCFVKWVHLFSQIHAPVFHTSLIFY